MQRAIVVDDSASLRLLTCLALEDVVGLVIVGEAGSAEEAVELVERTRPDVAIIDLQMPGMDGLELIKVIRARWPEIRLVAHSSDEPGLRSALSGGASAAVLKSPMFVGLVDAVAS